MYSRKNSKLVTNKFLKHMRDVEEGVERTASAEKKTSRRKFRVRRPDLLLYDYSLNFCLSPTLTLPLFVEKEPEFS